MNIHISYPDYEIEKEILLKSKSVYPKINNFNSNLGKVACWFALIMAIMQIMIIFLQQVFRANGFPLAFFGINILPDSDVITMPWFATELMFFNAIVIACACALPLLKVVM